MGAAAQPPERSLDPAERLEHARSLAWRSLNKRERTVAELRQRLARDRVEPALIDAVVDELCAGDWLDDAGYARRFAEDRRRLDGWGRERIARRLERLGVGAQEIEAALAEQDPDAERDAARDLLVRRHPEPPRDRRACERALGLLVRRGYALELAREVVRAYAGGPED